MANERYIGNGCYETVQPFSPDQLRNAESLVGHYRDEYTARKAERAAERERVGAACPKGKSK